MNRLDTLLECFTGAFRFYRTYATTLPTKAGEAFSTLPEPVTRAAVSIAPYGASRELVKSRRWLDLVPLSPCPRTYQMAFRAGPATCGEPFPAASSKRDPVSVLSDLRRRTATYWT
jgi:hypothetical protein